MPLISQNLWDKSCLEAVNRFSAMPLLLVLIRWQIFDFFAGQDRAVSCSEWLHLSWQVTPTLATKFLDQAIQISATFPSFHFPLFLAFLSNIQYVHCSMLDESGGLMKLYILVC